MNGQSGFVKKGFLSGLEKYADAEVDLSTQSESPWYILFHGYGADAHDLFGLHEYLRLKKTMNWFCPQGVLSVPIGPGWTGRAWWPLDMAAFERAALSGVERNLSDEKPEGLAHLREQVIKSIEKIAPWEQIILGGFSQGAMLATDIYLHAPKTPRGLTILSGALINQSEWIPLMKNRAGEEFFMSHGQRDPVLNIAGAHRLHTAFTTNGMKGSLIQFNGGHEIPPQALTQLQQYLDKKL